MQMTIEHTKFQSHRTVFFHFSLAFSSHRFFAEENAHSAMEKQDKPRNRPRYPPTAEMRALPSKMSTSFSTVMRSLSKKKIIRLWVLVPKVSGDLRADILYLEIF